MKSFKLFAIAALGLSMVTPSSASIVSGDWISDCDRSGDSIVCQRYGGFFNGFPPGCDAGDIFVCRGVAFCELATYGHYLASVDPAVIDPKVFDCGDSVNGRPVLTEITTL
jgi:hypothetical protein